MRYVDITRLVVVVVHGVPVVILGRREVRCWQCNVDIEESVSKQVWNDVQDFKLHETMDALYPKFLNELYEKYQHETDPRTIVQQCKRDKQRHA